MSLFSKLFGRNNRREEAVEAPTARHRRMEDEAAVPGMRSAPAGEQYAERPQYLDAGPQGGAPYGGNPQHGHGASVESGAAPRIGFPAAPSTSGGGFTPDPYAGHVQQGVPRQEAVNMAGTSPCPRCGN